jgi:hypothetical protein
MILTAIYVVRTCMVIISIVVVYIAAVRAVRVTVASAIVVFGVVIEVSRIGSL